MRKRQKIYYFGIRRSNNSTLLATNKQAVAEFIGISSRTILRHLRNSYVFTNDEYIIGKFLGMKKIVGGFALKY